MHFIHYIYAVTTTTTTPSLTCTSMTEIPPVPSPSCIVQGTYTSLIVLEAHYFLWGEQLMITLLLVCKLFHELTGQ